MNRSMRMVAGTYEGFCYGWADGGEDGGLTQTFGYNVHSGCVRCIAMCTSGTKAGKLLVTGGADEKIKIYDLEHGSEAGELVHHTGAISCLQFYRSTHLLSASEDCTICIWRIHDWALLHILGGHKAGVTALDIHPTGRLALSVSKDRTLRLWNLVEGRSAYIKRLQGLGEIVIWSPSGSRFAVVIKDTLQVYDSATSEIASETGHPLRINAVQFLASDDSLITCCEDRTLRCLSADGRSLGELDLSSVCNGRVRDARCFADPGAAGLMILALVTSLGGVYVWSLPAMSPVVEGGFAPVLRGSLVLRGEPRFTCMAACGAVQLEEPSKKNRKKRKTAGAPSPSDLLTDEADGGGDPEEAEDEGAVVAGRPKSKLPKKGKPSAVSGTVQAGDTAGQPSGPKASPATPHKQPRKRQKKRKSLKQAGVPQG